QSRLAVTLAHVLDAGPVEGQGRGVTGDVRDVDVVCVVAVARRFAVTVLPRPVVLDGRVVIVDHRFAGRRGEVDEEVARLQPDRALPVGVREVGDPLREG